MDIYSFALTLILVMDPLGNIPIFLTVLKKFDARTQVKIILRESFIAFVILVLFLFFGGNIMKGLKISTAALSVAGAIILFIISIRMIFPSEGAGQREDDFEEPLIVPLAVPLTAGPSALAILVLFSNRFPTHHFTMLIAVTISCAVFTIIMLFSRYLMKILGKRGLIALERLMGMILTTIAVQMLLSGIFSYIQQPSALIQ